MVLSNQKWTIIEQAFNDSSPYNYAIIDNFLSPEYCDLIRKKLLNNYKWRFKNWVSDHLHNDEPNIEEINEIKNEIKKNCPNIIGNYEAISHWALMYHKNTPGNIHSDNCAITITIWLTPEEYLLDKNSGGLILYDVKRSKNMMPHEHLVGESSKRLIQKQTKGEYITIPYKYNRAILFDAKTFHCSQQPNFNISTIEGCRINLSIAFDRLEHYQNRLEPYMVEYNKYKANKDFTNGKKNKDCS